MVSWESEKISAERRFDFMFPIDLNLSFLNMLDINSFRIIDLMLHRHKLIFAWKPRENHRATFGPSCILFIKHNQRWFSFLLLDLQFLFCFFSSACSSTLSYARYIFSLNRLSASPLWSFCLLILYFLPRSYTSSFFLFFSRLFPYPIADPAWKLHGVWRIVNIHLSEKAIYKTQKSFNKHYFLCRFFFLPADSFSHSTSSMEELLCVYLINNNSFPPSQNLIYLSLDYYFGAFLFYKISFLSPYADP